MAPPSSQAEDFRLCKNTSQIMELQVPYDLAAASLFFFFSFLTDQKGGKRFLREKRQDPAGSSLEAE